EGEELSALLRVPHLQLSWKWLQLWTVPTTGPTDEALAVGAKGHAGHSARVPLEGEELLALVCIPHLHRLVPTAAEEAFAVGAEGHAAHNARVPPESPLVAVVEGPEMAIFHVAQVPLAAVQDLQRSRPIAILPFALRLRQLPRVQRQLRPPQLIFGTLLLVHRLLACRIRCLLLLLGRLAC